MSGHPLAGRRQSPAHVAKRVAAVSRAKAAWSGDRREAFRCRIRAVNPMRDPALRQKMAASKRGKKLRLVNRLVLSPEERRLRSAARARRRRESPRARINCRMSAQIRHALHGRGRLKGGRRWEAIVGYSLEQLVERLKSTLPAGYSWTDLVSGRLEIDHIVPKHAFRFTTEEDPEFLRCWSLSNLQLLTREANAKKHGRLLAVAS